MGTVYFACGCSITTSMHGDHEVRDVRVCPIHNSQVLPQLTALANAVSLIQKEEFKTEEQ